MYLKQAVQLFGSKLAVAKKLNITSGAVSQWGDVVPEKQALRLEKITNGKLCYESSFYKKSYFNNSHNNIKKYV